MRRVGGFSAVGVVYFALLFLGIVLGVLVGGGTGATITAVAGALLGLTLLGLGTGVVVIGREPLGRRRPDPPSEDEGFRGPRT